MDEPNYVLKTNEAVLMPTEQNKGMHTIKICVWVIVVIIILSSIVFRDNIFAELSWPARIFLIVLAIGFGFYGGKQEYCPSPMELQFFDDYLILYLPKRYYSPRVTRMEINKMNYSDITRCVLKTRAQRIHLYGNGTSTWYNFRSDGTLPQKPTAVRNYTKGLIYFNIRLATDVDFIKEIETHSPLKVIVEDN